MKRKTKPPSRIWYLPQAQKNFETLVWLARKEGPQVIRIYGKKSVIVTGPEKVCIGNESVVDRRVTRLRTLQRSTKKPGTFAGF